MVGQHPLIVGLAFLDKNYTVRILSAPCPDMTSFEEGSKLGGSLGDETIVGNPVAMDEEKLFGNIMTLVPSEGLKEDCPLGLGPK